MGLFKSINKFLGSGIGGIATNILGGVIDDKRTRGTTRDQFEFLESKGLTPWEINSGGGGSSVVRASGSTLGNAPQVQAQTQRDFIAKEAALERENKRTVADIQTGPSHKQADIAGRMEPLRSNQIRETVKKLKNDVARGKIELENFWPILFAKMGPDNLMIAMSSMLEGVTPEQVLKTSGIKADTATRRQMHEVAAWLVKYKGVQGTAEGIHKGLMDRSRNILGAHEK